MQTAAATLAGNAFGANDEKRLKGLARAILPVEISLMILSGSLLFISAPILIRLFSSDEEVIRLGSTVLRMVAVSEPFYGVPIVIDAGGRKNSRSFCFQCSGNVGCENHRNLYLYSFAWSWPGIRLGLHDWTQYAAFCAVYQSLPEWKMESYGCKEL